MQEALGQNIDYTASLPQNFSTSYFSLLQRELVPACVIEPESVEQVSEAIRVIKNTGCAFAIKSGGHGIGAGASSVEGGIVFDLGRLNSIEVSEDKSTALLGTGNKWLAVYRRLEEDGLIVVGGRVGSVGVGDFTLGGGISFVSRQYGWAVDNVRNYEVVLPNGTIVNANQKSHPDLYFALRGGGNNFGIVTRFDFEAYEQGQFWGGTNVQMASDLQERRAAMGIQNEIQLNFHSLASFAMRWVQRAACLAGFCIHSTDLIDYFVGMATQPDASAHTFIFFSWIPEQRAYLTGATIAYSKPVVNPPAFQNLTSLKSVYSTNRLANMSEFALEIESQNPSGRRHAWDSVTLKVDATLISKILDIFLFEVDPLTKIPGMLPSTNLQLLTKHEISLSKRNGGNALGFKPDDGPLFLFSVTIFYSNTEDDELVLSVLDNTIKRAIALAKEMDLYHPFIYQNYITRDRGVFAGTGSENREKLLRIQREYDPDGVFPRLASGYCKL
ncbi:hypothetical protein F5884DRAFT_792907 [Xylogone sp. PMI_703]|nr:hypothetical protein F5884DRAFT_792907 [Xylogone sp. PMI_703]